jgi:hypothetical protein
MRRDPDGRSLKNSFAYAAMIYDQRPSVADASRVVGTPTEQRQAFRISADQIQAEVQRLVTELEQSYSEHAPIAA